MVFPSLGNRWFDQDYRTVSDVFGIIGSSINYGEFVAEIMQIYPYEEQSLTTVDDQICNDLQIEAYLAEDWLADVKTAEDNP